MTKCLQPWGRLCPSSAWRITLRQIVVRFCYRSADGEDGYPGDLSVAATYQVGAGRVLSWTAKATTDAPTIVNLVHHPYWNLSGSSTATIDQHIVQLFAAAYLPVTEGLIPTGEIRTVAGTSMDFRQPRPVGGEGVFGYNHCWVINRQSSGDNIALASRLLDTVSGRVLEISTNQGFIDAESLPCSPSVCSPGHVCEPLFCAPKPPGL